MLAPFMLPECLVISTFIFPIGVHVGKQVRFAKTLEDACDASVCSVTRLASLEKIVVESYLVESQLASKVPSQ